MTNVWLLPIVASDVMTKNVVSVGPETPTRAVATLLIKGGFGGMPVVDVDGAPIGMISESDLIGRKIGMRAQSRTWWLKVLAEGEDLAAEFADYLRAVDRPARDFMTAPVVMVAEDTPIQAIAEALQEHGIKRVPVVRDGRIVGIVSCADLVRALAKPLVQLPRATVETHGNPEKQANGLIARLGGQDDQIRP
jgi:CBS domain-containing protein